MIEAPRASASPVSGLQLTEDAARTARARTERGISDAVIPFTPAQLGRVLSLPCRLAAGLALGVLLVRAAVRLELRWDTFAYHLPFAARRAGIPVPYEPSDIVLPYYEGFPPLPHIAQGLLWRLTGSMNATGLVNALAFAGLLVYAQRCLGARLWLVALIALTAPLVVIHAASSYVDLFGNCFLAAGACSCLHLFLFPEAARRSVLVGGLLALVAAAWTKFQLVAVIAPLFCVFGAILLSRPTTAGLPRRRALLLCGLAVALGASPYLKNLVVYGNPFWPVRLPLIGDLVPYRIDPIAVGMQRERPPELTQLSQFRLFWHSLFEIDHPTSYPNRARWIIDQGNAWTAFRMGGFWNVAAGFYLVALVGSLLVAFRRRGAYAAAGALLLLAYVAALPQSNELRYYLFIPLSGAIALAMSMPRLEQRAPRSALGLLAMALGLFSYMVSENRVHYSVERIDQAAAAHAWGADVWWSRLQPGKRYCSVGMMPTSLLMTGPTLSEFSIVERSRADLCPTDSTPLPR
jgi:hypothetical protein